MCGKKSSRSSCCNMHDLLSPETWCYDCTDASVVYIFLVAAYIYTRAASAAQSATRV